MFLSKLFKHTRAKVLTALAGLMMVFGAAAAVSTVTATQQNEVVETKAANFTSTPKYFWWSSVGIDDGTNQYIRYWLYLWKSSGGYTSVIPMTPVGKDKSGSWSIAEDSWSISTTNAGTWNGGTGIYCADISGDSNKTSWDRVIIVRSKWETGLTPSNIWSGGDRVVNQSKDITLTGVTTNNAVYFSSWDNGKMSCSVGQVSFAKKMNGSTTLGYVAKAGVMTTGALGSATPTTYGKSFANWCTDSGLSTNFTDNTYLDATVYAKFSDTSTSTGYFSLTFFMETMWPVEGNLPTVYVEDANGVANAAFPGAAATKVSYEYGIVSYSIPNGATKIVIAVNGWTSGGAQTIDITSWASKGSNLYVLTGITSGKYSGDWHYTNYAAPTSSSSILPGYYFEGGSSWATTSLNHMGPNTANTKDKGHIDDFTVTAGQGFKVARRRTTSVIDEWLGYDSLDDASKALKNTSGDNLLIDDTENDHNIKLSAGETICVYLTSSNEISITTNSAKASAGYIYVTGTLSSITFYAYSDTSGSSQINTGKLSAITGIVSCSTAYMNNTATVHRIPIFNLRGTSGLSVGSFKLGTSGVIVAPSSNLSNTPAVYYPGSGSTVYNNEATGKLAKATYNIAVAISNADDASVCNLGSTTCSSLLTDYATWSGSSYYANAYIDTYNKAGAEKAAMISDGSHGKVSLANIVVQLNQIISGGAGARVVPVSPSGDSPLTVTLWIVLGSGVLGLGAIGTAYFVSKKKKHQA